MANSFDNTLSSSIMHWPSWLHGIMLTSTNIGQPAAMILLAGVIALGTWQHNRRITYSMAAAVLAMGINGLLKEIIHRPRPDTAYAHMFHSGSFPSGHAFGVTIVGGLLAYVALKYLPTVWGRSIAVFLALFILLVGLSRLYLGAHYPTDVFAGWLLGGLSVVAIVKWVKP